MLGEEAMEGFTIRTLRVINKKVGSSCGGLKVTSSVLLQSGKGHDVVQLHMTNWPRDGRCSNLTSIIDVISEMSKVQRRTGNNPIVVHCR